VQARALGSGVAGAASAWVAPNASATAVAPANARRAIPLRFIVIPPESGVDAPSANAAGMNSLHLPDLQKLEAYFTT
jgi:hypothetical protein